jgi:hypothetical protein
MADSERRRYKARVDVSSTFLMVRRVLVRFPDRALIYLWMRNFSALSDIEFEGLVGDLLAAELSTPIDRFSAGPDGGVDLRWKAAPDGNGVGQCKHYLRSSFSQLLSAPVARCLTSNNWNQMIIGS